MNRTLYYILKESKQEDNLSEFLDKISLKIKKERYLFK